MYFYSQILPVTKEQLVAAIRVLTDYKGVSLKEIEEALNIPKNSLSGMLSGSRPMPGKWKSLLVVYVLNRINVSPKEPTPAKSNP